MEKRIEVPDHNLFDEKSKEFFESKHAKRLQDKYRSKPYEEKYLVLYLVSKYGSWFCNGVSALLASTWVFSYLFSVVKQLPHPFVIATVFTVVIVVGLELLQRFLSGNLFKDWLQYGIKAVKGLIVGSLIVAGISFVSSYQGSFDFMGTVTSPPVYKAPTLFNLTDVKARYQDLVNTADRTATNYYNRRKYAGRIATEDAKKYQEYLDKGLAYRDSLNKAVNVTETKNEKKIEKAKENYQKAVDLYNSQTAQKGYGLGILSIIFIALFYLARWYQEYYDFKTASQYAILITKGAGGTNTNNPPLPHQPQGQPLDYQNLLSHVQSLIQSQKAKTKQAPVPSPSIEEEPIPKEPLNGSHNNTTLPFQLPIGFFSDGERQDQLKNLYIQQIQPYIQDFRRNEGIYSDKYTVAHRSFKTGKLEHLDLGTVTNRVGIYVKKIESSLSIGNKTPLPNQMEKLIYWIGKREELINKIGE